MNIMKIGALENTLRRVTGKKPFPEVNGHVLKPGAKLEGADLRRADLERVDLHGADLRGANFGRADLYRSDLRRADLSGAHLGHSILDRADLRSAKLGGADLRGADLKYANLPADLRGADLRYAIRLGDIRDAFVTGARWALQDREIKLRNFSDLPSRVAKKEGRFDQWITRDRSGEGPAAITRPAVNP